MTAPGARCAHSLTHCPPCGLRKAGADATDDLYAEAVAAVAAALPRSTPVGIPKRAVTALEKAGLLVRAQQPVPSSVAVTAGAGWCAACGAWDQHRDDCGLCFRCSDGGAPS